MLAPPSKDVTAATGSIRVPADDNGARGRPGPRFLPPPAPPMGEFGIISMSRDDGGGGGYGLPVPPPEAKGLPIGGGGGVRLA